MKFNEIGKMFFNTLIEANKDPYGARVVSYSKEWAELMESEMKKGKTIDNIFDKTLHEADTDGISGAMFGMSLSILKKCWFHGKLLKDYGQFGKESSN